MAIPVLSKEPVQFIEASTAEQIQTSVNALSVNILFSFAPADAGFGSLVYGSLYS